MGYLHYVLVIFLLAGTLYPVQGGDNHCRVDDEIVTKEGDTRFFVYSEDGKTLVDDACNACDCWSGQFYCMAIYCDHPNCADPILVPGQCCRECPNGPNCALPGGGTLAAGKQKVMKNKQVCSCPDAVNGLQMANCRTKTKGR